MSGSSTSSGSAIAARLAGEEPLLLVARVVSRAEALVAERVEVLRRAAVVRETVVLDRNTPLETPALAPAAR